MCRGIAACVSSKYTCLLNCHCVIEMCCGCPVLTIHRELLPPAITLFSHSHEEGVPTCHRSGILLSLGTVGNTGSIQNSIRSITAEFESQEILTVLLDQNALHLRLLVGG
jgi:hypothetical protein